MKKISKVCLGMAVLMLCSCGSNGGTSSISITSNGGGSSVSSSQEDEIKNKWWETTGKLEKDENGNVVFDDVDISLTTVVAGEDLTAFNQLIQQFNNEYRGKITVSATSINQSQFETTVSKQISNNSNPPDLIMSHQKGHKSFEQNKLIQPFNEAMDLSGINISMNDYAEGLAKYSTLGYKNYTFGIPIDAQSEVVYYNKKLLDKYGGQLPSTRAELIDLCTKVANGENILPIAWSTSLDFFSNYVFPTAIVQNGGHFYNDQYRADWYDDETNRTAFLNGIQSIREFTTHSPKLADYDISSSAALTNFLNDKALFFVGMPWNLNSILQTYAAQHGNMTIESVKNDRIGGTTLANWFAKDSTSDNGLKIFGDSHFFAMSKTVKNIEKKAAILEFMKWFTQNGSVGATWAEAGHISASTIIASDETYYENDTIKNYINMFYPDINYFECPGNTPYYSDTFTQLATLFIDSKNGGNSNNDANYVKTYQDAVNSTIEFIEM